MTYPEADVLSASLRHRISDGTIMINSNYWTWKSGVYAVVDCVFSSQAKYQSTVLPMLRERLPARPGMQDSPSLKFSHFIRDVDSFEPDKWDGYGRAVLNLQVLSGRRKVEVCYDIARFFVDRGYETIVDLHDLGESVLLHLVLDDLQSTIQGIGPALARYLAVLVGVESQIKPDTMILRFFSNLHSWSPRMGNVRDIAIIETVITRVAQDIGTTPARLDNAIWRHMTS